MKTKETILSDAISDTIGDAIPAVAIPALTLTNTEYNVLAVALDHMYEHLTDMRGDFDDYDDEITNINRLKDVQSLKEMFNL